MKKQHGFTLVELSIVLVILGLLAGGILAGQSLIQSAKLNKITSDINQYKTAVLIFEDEYGELPGDLSIAQSYWPACTDDSDNECNGNGNGIIETRTGSDDLLENTRAWEHMQYAGLVAGNLNGIADGINPCSPGINVPEAPNVADGGYNFITANGLYSADGLGIELSPYNPAFSCTDPGLSGPHIFKIDSKIDDGLPRSGKVLAEGGFTCPSSSCEFFCFDGNEEYILTDEDSKTCKVFFAF